METTDLNRIHSREVLNKALNELDSSKQTHSDDPEVNDVAQATKAMVWKLVRKVSDSNKQYTVSDILDAGSFYEGTKLGFPDEFDFMIVFDIGDFEIKAGCAKGLVEMQLTDDAGKNGAYVKSLTGRFRQLVTQLVSDLVYTNRKFECQGLFGSVSLGISSYPALQLKWKNKLTRKTKRIKIDLMPAIRCPVEYVNQLLDIIPQKHLHTIKKQGLYVVPKSCPRCPNNSCWHISFAQAEAFLMKQLDELHKAAYRIMKFLIQIKQSDVEEVVGGITSYSIKNSLLHHVYTFGCTEPTDLGGCLIRILHYIDQCYGKLNMPLFFMNTWCMFRLGSLAYCKLESVTAVQKLKHENKELLLNENKETICLSKETAVHCTWELLIWVEYQRRYVTLILSILEKAIQGESECFEDETLYSQANAVDVTDKHIAKDSETIVHNLESLVSLATLHQPAGAVSFDFMKNEGFVMTLKNDRQWIYLNDFHALKKEAETLFGVQYDIWNADEMWTISKAEGAGQSNVLSEIAPQSTDVIIYTRKQSMFDSKSIVTAQGLVAARKCFEIISEECHGKISDKVDSAITIVTLRSTKLTPQLYLVQFDLNKCEEESLSLSYFFDCLNKEIFGSEDFSGEHEMNDDDMDAYLSSLVEALEARSLNED